MMRPRIWQYLLLLLSGVPAFLFAYLGHFSRLIIDEHCLFHIARSMDAWESILYYYDAHTASFSRSLLHSVLAPLDVLATSLMPLAIVPVVHREPLLASVSNCREYLEWTAKPNCALDHVPVGYSRCIKCIHFAGIALLV